jgi:hypothetical protein
MRPGIGRIRPQLAQDAGLSFSVKVDARAALEWPITRPASNLIYEFAVRGSPTLLSKHSLPCCFPARSSRETPVQAIEMLLVLARLRLAPPCIFRKSPCIFPNCRERQVGLRLHPQPRSPARHWPSSRSMGARALQSENPRHTRFPVRKEIGRCESCASAAA